MAKSFLSRRVSEFAGVALFALALIWLIALVSYSAHDPVWFFNTGSDLPPANFAGRMASSGSVKKATAKQTAAPTRQPIKPRNLRQTVD